MSTTSRRRWTDETIEAELRAQTQARGRFPTRSELVDAGLRGLWDALRRRGDVEAWRARIEGPSPPVTGDPQPVTGEPQPVTPERIAARAYELYEAGAPGDHVSHWLAAERELSDES